VYKGRRISSESERVGNMQIGLKENWKKKKRIDGTHPAILSPFSGHAPFKSQLQQDCKYYYLKYS
jgi:hypothetical protein